MNQREPRADTRSPARGEWRAARLALLEQEKELTKRSDELARQRAALPWVPVDKDYTFDDRGGRGDARRPLLRSIAADRLPPDVRARLDRGVPRAARRSPTASKASALTSRPMTCRWSRISRAPLDRLLAYRDRMGWTFPWASSLGSDFNYDFHVTIDPAVAPVEYNYREPRRARGERRQLEGLGRRAAGHERVRPRRGRVFHAYSAYARGLDALWGRTSGSTGLRSAATRTATGGACTTNTSGDARR